MNRTDRIKELRSVLIQIEEKCDQCCHIGTWFCNRECDRPGLREITIRMLEREGACVGCLLKCVAGGEIHHKEEE